MRFPQTPPDVWGVLSGADPATLQRIHLSSAVDAKGRYLHWDEVRHRRAPDGLTHEQWWAGVWLARRAASIRLPLVDTAGRPFRFGFTVPIQALAHRIDSRLGDHILVDRRRSDRRLELHHVKRLLEEAITSSQLEGAVTTRPVAAEMLRSGRRPRTHGERMILNNYRAMTETVAAAENGAPLDIEMVCGLHATITRGTLADERDAGRPQQPGEDRIGIYFDDGRLLHRPPDAVELPERMKSMCDFANAAADRDDVFVHPLIRAVILHFWLAHDHPFVDGNGRTARALFYWSLLRSGYGLAPYTSISTILRRAPVRYVRSFLKVYTDDNDLTYFVAHQLDVLDRSIEALDAYIQRKRAETAELTQVLSLCHQLNHRQRSAILHTVEDRRSITIGAHSDDHRVTHQTARVDLLGLVDMGLFHKTRIGRKHLFEPVDDVSRRLLDMAGR